MKPTLSVKKLLKFIDALTAKGVKVLELSGTPFSAWLGTYYQKLIKPTTMKELISIGALCKYEFYAPSHPDMSEVKPSVQAG